MKSINLFLTPRFFHIATAAILAIFGLHVLLALGAFFTFNLSVNSLTNAYEWWYPIAESPGYIGTTLHLDLAVLILLLVTPVVLVICGIQVMLTLWKRRGQMARIQQIASVVALFIALILLPLLASPFGYAIGLWFFD